jgi:Mg2+ and Co2+ transporter CorA
MNADPRYALTEVFAFVAASECQFLNMLQCQIDRELQLFESHMEWSLANLRYYKASLDSHAQQLEATLVSLKRRDMFNQPVLPQTGQPPNEQDARMKKDQSGESDIADCTVQSLVADFEHLYHQTSRLADKCVEGTTIIVNHAMLEGSRKAIHQAERSGRLTLLAFFFLPLSFTTSFFGMNFIELGTGKLSIWYAFAISVPVLLFSVAMCFWDSTIIAFRKS